MSIGRECKKFLMAMAFDNPTEGGETLDTSEWVLDASDHEGLRTQIQAYLLHASARVSDLYNLLTDESRKPLNKPQFVMSMYEIGYEGDSHMIKDLFDEFDTDGNGYMSMDELYSWMNGKLYRSKLAREVNFGMRPANARPLNQIAWTPQTMRLEMQRLLIQCGLSPLDLLNSWAQGDGTFDKREVCLGL